MKTNCIRVKILVTMIKVLLCENWKKKMFSENSQHVFFSHRILTRFESYIGIILIRTFFRSRQRMSFWFISGTQKMLLNRGFCFFLFMSNFFLLLPISVRWDSFFLFAFCLFRLTILNSTFRIDLTNLFREAPVVTECQPLFALAMAGHLAGDTLAVTVLEAGTVFRHTLFVAQLG